MVLFPFVLSLFLPLLPDMVWIREAISQIMKLNMYCTRILINELMLRQIDELITHSLCIPYAKLVYQPDKFSRTFHEKSL